MLVWLGLGWSVLNVNATGGIHVLAFTLTMSTAMSSRVVVVPYSGGAILNIQGALTV